MSLLEAYVLFVLPSLFLAVCGGALVWGRVVQRRRNPEHPLGWRGLDGDGI